MFMVNGMVSLSALQHKRHIGIKNRRVSDVEHISIIVLAGRFRIYFVPRESFIRSHRNIFALFNF